MALSTGGRRDHPALLGDIWSLCMKYLQYHDRDLVSCCQVSREVRAASQIYLYREIVVGTENRAAGLLEAIEVDDRIAMLIKKLHVHTVYYESVRDGDVWDNRVVTWAHESTTLPTLIPKLTQVTWLHVVLDSENSLHHNLLGQHLSKLPAIRSLDVAERGSSRFDLPDALAVFVNHFTGLHKLALESEVTSNRMIDHVDRLSATGVLASEPEELSVKLPEDRYTLEWLLQKLPPLKTLRLYDPDQMTSELYQAAAEKSKETLHELYFCTESSHDNPLLIPVLDNVTIKCHTLNKIFLQFWMDSGADMPDLTLSPSSALEAIAHDRKSLDYAQIELWLYPHDTDLGAYTDICGRSVEKALYEARGKFDLGTVDFHLVLVDPIRTTQEKCIDLEKKLRSAMPWLEAAGKLRITFAIDD